MDAFAVLFIILALTLVFYELSRIKQRLSQIEESKDHS